VSRRRFEHLVVELSVAVGVRINRYALWLALHEQGVDPERFGRGDALRFCDGPLREFLADRRLLLPERERRRLRKSVGSFDAARPTPEELFSALSR
jgi:hypothetical protein